MTKVSESAVMFYRSTGQHFLKKIHNMAITTDLYLKAVPIKTSESDWKMCRNAFPAIRHRPGMVPRVSGGHTLFILPETHLMVRIFLTLNLLPTLMKLSFPAFCLTSLLLLEFSKSSRTKRSLDSLTRHSRDMCRASLFFSTNLVWERDIFKRNQKHDFSLNGYAAVLAC